MQKPWIAATVGQGSSATFWNTAWPRRIASLTVPLRSNSWNSFRSAPAMKPLALPERNTTALGGSIARRSTMSPSSIRTSWDSALTAASERSSASTTTPSSRLAACQWLNRSPSRPGSMGEPSGCVWKGRLSSRGCFCRVKSHNSPRGVRLAVWTASRDGKWPPVKFLHRAVRAGQNVQSGSGPRQVAELFPAVAVTWHGSAAPTGVRPGVAEGTQKDPPQELDLELVRRVQRGETAAFDLLVRKYQHRIVALIGRYVQDWSECQDVAQDTFVRAYRAIGNFRGDAQFYTWLHRIAVNTAKNHLVAHNRRPPTDDIDASDAEQYDVGTRLRDTDTPEREAMREELERT